MIARHVAETFAPGVTVRHDAASGAVVRWPLPDPPPKVSVLIPTRDNLGLTRAAVASVLERSTYPDVEIVIVDNDSVEQETLDWLEDIAVREPRVRVERVGGPFNFSALNNSAAERATGQVLALLNNDTEVLSPDWLEEMVSLAIRPDTGCVGALLLYPNGTVQHAGVVLGMRRVAGHAFRGFPGDAEGYMGRLRRRQDMTALTAACLVVRREVYLEAGGMDEEGLPVAYNDVDFCLRVRACGYRNVWTPFARLLHHESLSRGRDKTRESRRRLRRDAEILIERWSVDRFDDPAYNPNLTHETEDFAIAAPHEVRNRQG